MSGMPKTKVLIVDDEPAIRKLLERGLSGYGYEVIATSDGRVALEIAAHQSPEIILLDINLEKEPDGLEICQQIREWSKTPIIMLTVRDEKPIRLAALNVGADDYIIKPFDMEELEARMRTVMRRSDSQGVASASGEINIHDLVVDLIKRRVMLNGEEIHLTPKEYNLLKILVTNPGRVITFQTLLQKVWGDSAGAEHNVRVYVNTLRKKLKDDPSSVNKPRFIFNEPGIGYRFTDF